MVKRLLLISLIAAFILFEAAFNYFLETENVFNQTSIAVFRYFVLSVIILNIKTHSKWHKIIFAVFVGYWLSALSVYVINGVMYHDFYEWAANFNDMIYLRIMLMLSYISLSIAIRTFKTHK